MNMSESLLFVCPHPECERAFDEEYKLDQHMDDKDHHCDWDDDDDDDDWDDWDDDDDDDDDDDECHCETCDECESELEEDSSDDETPSPALRLLPPRQASKDTMRKAGDALRDPDSCDDTCKLQLAAAHMAVGRLCSICWLNRAKIDCPHNSCGNCCSGCEVH